MNNIQCFGDLKKQFSNNGNNQKKKKLNLTTEEEFLHISLSQ